MTTRETSRAAFDALVASGKLKGKQRQILDELIKLGSATSGEVLDALDIRNVNAWRARFTELSARGLIQEQGERLCRISGRRCVVWVPTARIKPLDVRKGARNPINGKAWRDMAVRLAGNLERACEHATDEVVVGRARATLEVYKRLQALNGTK